MIIFRHVPAFEKYIEQEKRPHRKIGFVPTMGALHEGHLSLIRQSIAENQVTICSIFVNPTQFNDPEDLKKYPRPIERDIEMLTLAGVTVLFLPSVAEMYPADLQHPTFVFNGLDLPMEGASRPGHFDGVAQVVHRLLGIAKPDRLYMGQKDFQQWAIVQSMLRQMNADIELVRCPIAREKDGLAMSSRNVRLTDEVRPVVPSIYKILEIAKTELETLEIETVKNNAIRALKAIPEFDLDYFEIADGNSLEPIMEKRNSSLIVACVAVFVAKVRLIDNLILKG